MKFCFGAVIGILFAIATAWGADPAATLTDQAVALNRTAQTAEGERVVVQRLSRELNLSAGTLQQQREQTKLGWGEILIANRLAQQTGLPFSQIVSEFRSGQGWGQMAREHNLNLGKLVSDVKEARGAVEAQARRMDRNASDVSTEPGARGQGVGSNPMGPGFGGGAGRGSHGGRSR